MEVKEFRITYRNEIYIKAETEEEARLNFQNLNWEDTMVASEFVEVVTVEEEIN
jgi:hypothetical protein